MVLIFVKGEITHVCYCGWNKKIHTRKNRCCFRRLVRVDAILAPIIIYIGVACFRYFLQPVGGAIQFQVACQYLQCSEGLYYQKNSFHTL